MEAKREQRYFQKIAELEDKIEFIQEHLSEEEEFLSNRILRKAIYKEFQEMVEIIADLSAMVVRDKGKVVEDDYSNLERMTKILGSESLLEDLKEANGLRNILVHEYNGVVDKQAYNSIKNLLTSIEKFGVMVEKWIKRG